MTREHLEKANAIFHRIKDLKFLIGVIDEHNPYFNPTLPEPINAIWKSGIEETKAKAKKALLDELAKAEQELAAL